MIKELFLNVEKTTDTLFFDKLNETQIFYSYFQVDQNYYLFSYTNQFIDVAVFYENLAVIQELNTKERKIRSIRGFLLYVLEIMETGEEVQILNTNLDPFFWNRAKNVLRQSKKKLLLEFLFGKDIGQDSNPQVEEMIQTLQNQVNSLQDRISNLEINLETIKCALSDILETPRETKTIHQGHSTLKSEKSFQSANLLPKDREVRKPTYQEKEMEEKGLTNFRKPATISEAEKIEIIQMGFHLNQEGKISLKKYYESTDDQNSLYQFKGYSIKYESIRNTQLYKQELYKRKQ